MEPGTFSQIYIQFVFAVDGRRSLISEKWEEDLYKYITGIVTKKNQKVLSINGSYDHLHLFVGTKLSCCPSDLLREVKKSSNTWINENRLTKAKFNWQVGGAGFSYSKEHIDRVVKYIHNQKEHHKTVRFKDEYIKMLQDHDIEFKDEYLFKWIED
ncbi:transposase [Cryomorpha ignava]|uniref:Transposase n=1 Tax=Cryomorpha ignava TaxID=101383 RepID=A0A7K3WNH3_9FLAO|nr:transposase [Cryomorpha ignava]NEN23199.1 transposase [Cryomorpha ignava]